LEQIFNHKVNLLPALPDHPISMSKRLPFKFTGRQMCVCGAACFSRRPASSYASLCVALSCINCVRQIQQQSDKPRRLADNNVGASS
jgi:hypothetical protein